MFDKQALIDASVSSMISSWKYQPVTDNTKKIFESYAKAFVSALESSLKSITINGGLIVGGVSPPSGPVVGAVLSFLPGSAVATTPLSLEEHYTPPDFRTPNGAAGEYTAWLRTLTRVVDTTCLTAFQTWLPLWTYPGGPVAGGGIASWIPPVPVPSPGPWVGGTITTPFSFLAPGFGINPSPVFSLLPTALVATAKTVPVSIQIGDSKKTVPLCNTDVAQNLISAIASGLASCFYAALSPILVIDTTKSGIGTASPPSGSIVGGTISGCTLEL